MDKNNEKNKQKKYKFKGQKEIIISDVNGSYTGVPIDEDEVPVQDVDDL